jgi:hypothetical protein
MPSIIKVDQIQSDLGTVNVSSNLQFSSGFTMQSPTFTTPTTSGVLTLGAGIKFPATQVSDADGNTLDDYEEGTWTPTISSASGTITTSSFSGAKYTKIGNIVEATVNITITTVGTASGACTFTLPFTGTDTIQLAGYGMETNTNGAMLKGYLPSSSATMQITMYNNTSPFTLGNGSVFAMNVVYQV